MILFGANAQLASLRDRKEVESRESRVKSSSSARNRKRQARVDRIVQRAPVVQREAEDTLELMSEVVAETAY